MSGTASGAGRMKPLVITVHGVPIPKGSTRAFVPKGWKRPIVTADNTKSRPWQEAVKNAAVDALSGAPPLEDRVVLAIRFFLPRPKSAPRRVTEHLKKPDLDKLIRTVKDGLTRAGVYRDDSQVVLVLSRKDFAGGEADPHGPAGVPRAVIAVTDDVGELMIWPFMDHRPNPPLLGSEEPAEEPAP